MVTRGVMLVDSGVGYAQEDEKGSICKVEERFDDYMGSFDMVRLRLYAVDVVFDSFDFVGWRISDSAYAIHNCAIRRSIFRRKCANRLWCMVNTLLESRTDGLHSDKPPS